jgi:hypothetical protein
LLADDRAPRSPARFRTSRFPFAISSGGFMRALIVPFALVSLAAQAQTAPLNDTGVTLNQCVSGGALVACTNATTGDAAPEPRQDARFGRDAAAGQSQLTKTGGGAAGFDFTALDASGAATAPGSHACVHDNVTNLTWEVKTPANMNTTYTWANAAAYAATVNGSGLCGSHSPWRVPTRRELFSIVHYGTTSPAIDTNYFPNTASTFFWTSDIYAPDPALAWLVVFEPNVEARSFATGQTLTSNVRLVRSGQ